ncbi:ribosome-inactivating family protein [Kitasatospora sp. NPDC089797]|uniref:ribosome-inactivating family protein n=1 Tax=Kitasatospora sp. NPDC089797 TaxID=3155298 RepID=UPI00343A212B
MSTRLISLLLAFATFVATLGASLAFAAAYPGPSQNFREPAIAPEPKTVHLVLDSDPDRGREDYKQFMDDIRAVLQDAGARPIPNANPAATSLLFTQRDAQRLLRIQILDSTGQGAQLFMRADNLYLTGFSLVENSSAQNTYYFLNPQISANGNRIPDPDFAPYRSVDGYTTVNLPYGSVNYDGLSREAGGQAVGDVALGGTALAQNISNFVSAMRRYTTTGFATQSDRQNVARAILAWAVTVAEATRFTTIRARATQHWGDAWTLGAQAPDALARLTDYRQMSDVALEFAAGDEPTLPVEIEHQSMSAVVVLGLLAVALGPKCDAGGGAQPRVGRAVSQDFCPAGQPFADAALPVPGSATDLYFFRGSEYIRYKATGGEAVTEGPTDIVNLWPVLRGTVFQAGFDSVTPMRGSADGEFYMFRGDQVATFNPRTGKFTLSPVAIEAKWPGLTDTVWARGIPAIVPVPGVADPTYYVIRGDMYAILNTAVGGVTGDQPLSHLNLKGGFGSGIDFAAVTPDDGSDFYLFRGDQYLRYYTLKGSGDAYNIDDQWKKAPALKFARSIDSGLPIPPYGSSSFAYLFSRNRYATYNLADPNAYFGPLSNWKGLPADFQSGFDAVVSTPDGTGDMWIFRGNLWLRYYKKTDSAGSAYPIAAQWHDLPAEFNSGIQWGYLIPGTQRVILGRADRVVEYDLQKNNVVSSQSLLERWPGLKDSGFDYILTTVMPVPGKPDDIYLLRGARVQEYDTRSNTLLGHKPWPVSCQWRGLLGRTDCPAP